MKKIIGLFSFVLLTITSHSQEYDITFESVRSKVVLSPAIRSFDESVKYFVEYPQELTYHKVKRGNEIWGINNLGGVEIDAKKAKKQKMLTLFFE